MRAKKDPCCLPDSSLPGLVLPSLAWLLCRADKFQFRNFTIAVDRWAQPASQPAAKYPTVSNSESPSDSSIWLWSKVLELRAEICQFESQIFEWWSMIVFEQFCVGGFTELQFALSLLHPLCVYLALSLFYYSFALGQSSDIFICPMCFGFYLNKNVVVIK